MLTTLLVSAPWLVPAGLACFAALSPFLGVWLASRPRTRSLLLWASVATLLLLVFLPTGRELSVQCAAEWTLPTPGAVEVFANVALFVPVTFFVGLSLRRPWRAGALLSAGSALIEATQALLPAIGRSCSTGDWFANTLGALLGSALATFALWAARRWNETRNAPPANEPLP